MHSCVDERTHKIQFSSSDETMMENGLYSSIHRDPLHKSSFAVSNGMSGSPLPPLPKAQPSPYMQPETSMSQNDPPVR